jgi:hypothetical protein
MPAKVVTLHRRCDSGSFSGDEKELWTSEHDVAATKRYFRRRGRVMRESGALTRRG